MIFVKISICCSLFAMLFMQRQGLLTNPNIFFRNSAMKIKLDLSAHCIETEIKRLYNRALSDYFKKEVKGKGRIEKSIELTRRALENLDFAQLRIKYSPLAGHTDRSIVLAMDKNKISITIDGRPIEPITKDSFDESG